jgi:uncharacterized membrane protein
VAERERERDLERLLTFVDAVVAIAITLLVLPLAEVGKEVRTGEVAELLNQHANDLWGFALSFVVIARLWVAQHAIVRSLVRQSTALIYLLLFWAFTIVFLPFPTTLVTGTSDDTLAKVLYIGTMAVSAAVLAAIAWVIGRSRDLRDTDAKPDAAAAGGTAVAFLLALAVSATFPAAGWWPLLLLLLVDPVVHRLRRRGRSHRAAGR